MVKSPSSNFNCSGTVAEETKSSILSSNEDLPNFLILEQTPKQVGNPYVICGEREGAHIVNLQKSWRRIRKKAGLDDLRIHDLRHTFASQAVMNGTPLALVSKLLGHAKITTTMRYAHLADSELLEASEGIGVLLKD